MWFMPPHAGPTMPLTHLGMPHRCNINALGSMRIEDISGGGIRFSFPKTDRSMIDGLRQHHCYIFLKLRHPVPTKMAICCLFLGISLIQASTKDDRVHVRCKILSRGTPVQGSKQFQLFNVSRVGVRDISVWCEEIELSGRGIAPPVSAGIDLEYLLLELSYEHANAHAASATPCPEFEGTPLIGAELAPHPDHVTGAAGAASPPGSAQAEVERLMRATGIHPAGVKPA